MEFLKGLFLFWREVQAMKPTVVHGTGGCGLKGEGMKTARHARRAFSHYALSISLLALLLFHGKLRIAFDAKG